VLTVLVILACFYPKSSFGSAWSRGNGGTTNQALATGSGSTFSNAAPTVVLFAASTVCGNNITYDPTTVPGTFTFNSTNSYNIDFNAVVNGAAGEVFAYLQVGGVAIPYPGLTSSSASADGNTYVNLSTQFYFTKGQTAQVIIAHTSGAAAVIDNVLNPAVISIHRQV